MNTAIRLEILEIRLEKKVYVLDCVCLQQSIFILHRLTVTI